MGDDRKNDGGKIGLGVVGGVALVLCCAIPLLLLAAGGGDSCRRLLGKGTNMSEKTDRKLLTTGIIGTAITALCCFTPILVILLSAVGLSVVLGWIDYVLFPALAIFIALSVYALWRRNRAISGPEERVQQ